jgi:hypothetical protein
MMRRSPGDLRLAVTWAGDVPKLRDGVIDGDNADRWEQTWQSDSTG